MPGRIRAGTSLIARGEFSIVIAGLTLSAGVQPRLASLAAAYVIVLAVVGPIAARLSDPIGRRVARARRTAGVTDMDA
jgi:CPA2 family monovalent cation:H+ antiporter-2